MKCGDIRKHSTHAMLPCAMRSPSCSVSGNNLVKRAVSFTPTLTDRIRINVTGALSGYSRITEVEAWGN